jgi:hypothetical protein
MAQFRDHDRGIMSIAGMASEGVAGAIDASNSIAVHGASRSTPMNQRDATVTIEVYGN